MSCIDIHGTLNAATNGADNYAGTSRDNSWNGMGGADSAKGGGGNDSLEGGNGGDLLCGESGNDTLRGGNQGDTLIGGGDQDVLYGQQGNDSLEGSVGNDTLYGGDNSDTLYGGSDQDLLYGQQGSDSLGGNLGNDTLYGGDNRDTLSGGGDQDVLYGQQGNDTLRGDDGEDTLYGGDDHDSLQGGNGDDTLHGQAGNDTLRGDAGADDFCFTGIIAHTDLGNGRYQVETSSHGVDTIEDLESSDRIMLGRQEYDIGNLFSDFDSLDTVPTDGGDSGDGHTAAPKSIQILNPPIDFFSQSQPSIFYKSVRSLGQSPPPRQILRSPRLALTTVKEPKIQFQLRSKTPDGQSIDGNETVVFNITPSSPFKFTSEVVYAFQSNREIQTVGISQNPKVGFSQVTIVALDDDISESARFFGTGASDRLIGKETDDALFGFAGNDTILGRQGSDDIYGGAGADRIRGEAGKDALYGNSGRDFLHGGDGDDTLNGGEEDDTLIGGEGNDTVIGWTGLDFIKGDAGDDLLKGEYGNDTLLGGNGNDTLSGGLGSNILEGGLGHDWVFEYGTDMTLHNTVLSGLGKSKLISIESASLTGLNSDDKIDASRFSNGGVHLFGKGGDDTLLGGSRDDSLQGDEGNDLLVGGAGFNILNGTSYENAGYEERDVLDGGKGENNSLFILGALDQAGRSAKVFYQNSNREFASIKNFDVRNSAEETEFDLIQLVGKMSDYRLIQAKSEAKILLGSRLIAKVSLFEEGELDLKNRDHFQFVNASELEKRG